MVGRTFRPEGFTSRGIVMSESEAEEKADKFASAFKDMDETNRRKAILGTSLTVMGLEVIQEELGQMQADMPADRVAVTAFLRSHIAGLTESLTQALASLTKLNAADAVFVSRLLMTVFDLNKDWSERNKGEEHVESTESSESQKDGGASE
jgi:acyl-homoserine lactone acylase PvdQ